MKCVLAALLGVTLALPLYGAKGELTVANHGEPVSLDPAFAQGPPDQRIASALLEGLVTLDAKTLAAKPGLADRWTVSADGRTYRFHLRKTSWSDGVALTAPTVRLSWLRVLDPKTASPWRATLGRWIQGAAGFATGTQGPESVELSAPDDQNLVVTFVHPLPALSLLADLAWVPVPLHAIDQWGPDWTQPGHLVSSGPYRLERWLAGASVVLDRNPAYWDPKAAKLTKVTFLPVDDDSGLRLYLAGKVDWLASVPEGRWDEVRGRRGFHSGALTSTLYLRLNVGRSVLADVRVRRALALGVDRTLVSTRAFSGSVAPLSSFTPSFPGYLPPGVAIRTDVKAAQKLLADAGFPGGQGFPDLTLLINSSDRNRRLAETVIDQWQRNLGITVGLVTKDWTGYQADLAARRYDLARSAWRADYNDPLSFLELWTNDSPANATGYANPDYDTLVAQARDLPGGLPRLKLLRQAETLLLADLPFVPLGTELSAQMIDLARWSGWFMNPQDVHPWRNLGPTR